MAKVKVIFDHGTCIGAGVCSVVCEKYWDMGEDGKAILLGSSPVPGTDEQYQLEVNVDENDLSCLRTSEESCPAQAITVFEE